MQVEVISENVEESAESSLFPKEFRMAFILVTSLFFMWAIAHNMNDILIRQFQKALDLSRGQASFIQVSFYFAYLFAAIPAGLLMKRAGFKNAIIVGLALYAIGASLFYPAAEARSYTFFLFALFVIACGIVCLETAGSAYITLTGEKANAARRLNFTQSFNGAGAIVAPIIGGLFVFSGVEYTPAEMSQLSPEALEAFRASEASQVQIPYLVIAGIVFCIAVLVYFTTFQSPRQFKECSSGVRYLDLFSISNFRWAVIAQFFYVGAQIGTWSYFLDFCTEMLPGTPEKTAAYYLSLTLVSFMVGRFIGTIAMKYYAPRKLLSAYAVANIALVLLAVFSSGVVAVVALGATCFFMSIMFPTIYALGLEGLDEQAEVGSSLIIMTIIGGAIFPPMMGYWSDNASVQVAYLIPVVCYAMVWVFAKHKPER